ncbi:MAG: hypothetical protein ACRD1T_20340, partial [Acidimicrobiia bacterium]
YEYVASLPTGNADPAGLVSYNFQEIKDIPWSPYDLAGDLLGATVPTHLAVSCDCVCCPEEKKKNNWKYECSLKLDLWIFLDEAALAKAAKKPVKKGELPWSTETAYGHEQKHAEALQKAVKEAVDKEAERFEECNWTKEECKRDKAETEKKLTSAAAKGLSNGAGHDAPGKPDKSKPHKPADGTDVGKNKKPDKPPTKAPPNLEDFWRQSGVSQPASRR